MARKKSSARNTPQTATQPADDGTATGVSTDPIGVPTAPASSDVEQESPDRLSDSAGESVRTAVPAETDSTDPIVSSDAVEPAVSDVTAEAATESTAIADEPAAGPAEPNADAAVSDLAADNLTDEPAEPTAEVTTERIIEAVLFASDTPLTLTKIVDILGTGSAREVRKIIDALNKSYARQGHAFRIEEIAGGYQLLTLPEYNTWLRRLKQSRQESKLTPAAMETLAVIAYKQPAVRAEIEAIRGVAVGEVVNRLRELNLIKIVGRAEDVGRPILYGTTKHFLEVFGLGSLEDLPAVEELRPPG